MLNLDHPKAKFIFHASGPIDGVKVRCQVMSVVPSNQRRCLLAECLPIFEEMHALAEKKFPENLEFLKSSIREYEEAAKKIAELGDEKVAVGAREFEERCTICGSEIIRFIP